VLGGVWKIVDDHVPAAGQVLDVPVDGHLAERGTPP
jgi:hypothetical protein